VWELKMNVIQVNMHEAKSQLSYLAERVMAGDRVIIAKAGKPYLDLMPHQVDKPNRVPGCLQGKLVVPDNFDESDQELIDLFENSDL
jgi:antitoxin (DNA-binding transcriptional repressor) of toxin-antitoxin stability system